MDDIRMNESELITEQIAANVRDRGYGYDDPTTGIRLNAAKAAEEAMELLLATMHPNENLYKTVVAAKNLFGSMFDNGVVMHKNGVVQELPVPLDMKAIVAEAGDVYVTLAGVWSYVRDFDDSALCPVDAALMKSEADKKRGVRGQS